MREALAGADAIINLAGAPVLRGRWTARRRKQLVDSRVDLTEEIVAALAELPAARRPSVLLSASAVGFYGDRPDGELVDARSEPGSGFLAELCQSWERAALSAQDSLGLRVAALRIGLVLGHGGGLFESALPLFRMGLGGRLGSGRQFMPWIHLRDVVEVFATALVDERYAGAMNLTAPTPVTNAEFTERLGRWLRRPTILPAPSLALRVVLGQAAQVVLGGQRAAPTRLLELGYEFRYPTLDAAFEHLLGGALAPVIGPLSELGELPEAARRSEYLRTRGARYALRKSVWIDAPPEEVFDFFCRAENLGVMTPRAMRFHILTPTPIEVERGAVIDYTIQLGAAPLRWRTEIAAWEPSRRFVDVQLRGPYSAWWHEHRFHAERGGTRMEDLVLYRPPLGPLGRAAHSIYVAPMLRQIFSYRTQMIALRFGRGAARAPARASTSSVRPAV